MRAMCVSRAKGRVVTHETLGRRAFVRRPLLVVTLFGLLLLGAAAAGAVLSWTGSGDSTSAVASPSAIAEPGEPLGTIIFQGVVDRLASRSSEPCLYQMVSRSRGGRHGN